MKSYYQYWGKADDPIKIAYCSGVNKKAILADSDLIKRLANKLKRPENKINESDLDQWATKNQWQYKQPNYQAYHLLPYHCLDVAAVASCWWDKSQSLRKQFTQTMQIDNEQQAKAWVLFFVALHDLGKLDIRFQMKANNIAIQLQPDIPKNIKKVKTDYYHGDVGYAWFLHELTDYGFNSSVKTQASKWLKQVAGHHGVIPASRQDKQSISGVSPLLIMRDKQARIDWINALKELFSVDLNHVPENVPPLLAGFCSVCDWIGSSDYFGYETKSDIKLFDYLKSRRNNAEQALKAFRLLSELKSEANTLESLFPLQAPDGSAYKPKGLQTLVQKLPLEQNLTLIEAPTGSGKTETALVYAANLLHKGLADSIIFALPTQATANAMLDRLEAMADNLFEDGATVVLAHGKSKLKDNLKKILATDKQTVQGLEEANYQAVRWLTASKKRAFLGQIGVCTIDQVLLSVLPVRHKFVRGFGVQKSVLIVDEVHAYDSYMYGLLEEVLKQQYQAGGSALLLSATLPQQQRAALAKSWQTDIEPTKIYPLISQIYANQTYKPFYIEDNQQLPATRTVELETWALANLQFDDDSLNKIITAALQGAKVAIICNLVADAQDLFERLKELTDLPIDLFHSRFRFLDRQTKELSVKNLYGKGKDKRAKEGRILVATQVIEQSLDLDFDWMISQLCPVDLLFQRMGRLHRHQRAESERPKEFNTARFVVIIPEQAEKYGDSRYVYQNLRALWRTEQLVTQLVVQHKSVTFPEAYRDWIELVYQEKAWQDEPVEMTASYETYQGEVQDVKRMLAKTIVECRTNPLSDESDKATTLTRDGEMSLTILPILEQNGKRLTLDEQLIDEDSKQYGELVSLQSVCVPASWQFLFMGCSQKDGIIYLPMQKISDKHWQTTLDQWQLSYSSDLGFYKQKL